MWGNTFADLAKKAQDLQEQAKEQASHMSTPSFFNLDAMQEDGEQDGNKEMFITPQPSAHAKKTSMNSAISETAPPSATKKPAVVKKLDMDSQDASMWDSFGDEFGGHQSQTATTKPPAQMNTLANSAGASSSAAPAGATIPATEDPCTSDSNADDGGWNDDDDLLELTASNEDDNTLPVAESKQPSLADPESTPVETNATSIFSNVLPVMEATDDKDTEANNVAATSTSEPTASSPLLESLVHNGGNATQQREETEQSTSFMNNDNPLQEDEEEIGLDETEHSVPLEGSDVFASAFHASSQNTVDHQVQVDNSTTDQNATTAVTKEGNVTEVNDDHFLNYGDADQTASPPVPLDSVPADTYETAPTGDASPIENDNEDTNDSSKAVPPPETTDGVDIGTTESDFQDDNGIVETLPNDEEEEEVDAMAIEEPTVSDEPNTVTVSVQPQEVSNATAESVDDAEPTLEQRAMEQVTGEGSNESRVVSEPLGTPEVVVEETNDDEAAIQHPNVGLTSAENVAEMVDSSATRTIPAEATSSQLTRTVPTTVTPPSGVSRKDHELELQQLRNDHKEEMVRLSQQHENQLQEMIDSFNHGREQQRQEMEARFMDQIRGKEEQLQELMRENEGYQLKIDVLKREVNGTQELLEQRDSAIGNTNASHSKNVELLEQRIKEMNDLSSRSKAESQQVKEELKSTKAELETSNEAYTTLKARVKGVAAELKERRVECRSLSSNVTDLKQANEQLESQIGSLQSQLSDRDRTQTEKDTQVKELQDRIETLEMQLHMTQGELKGRDAVGEKALSTYKKKAQNALAVANARAAAANQAKEEAELEAANVRTMSEEAIARAKVAEDAGNAALAEAKEYVREMETEKMALEKELLETKDALESTTAEMEQLKSTLDASRIAQDKLEENVKGLTHGQEEERSRNHELQHELEENQRRLELLYEEVETLREDLRQANTTIAASSSSDANEKEPRSTTSAWTHHSRTSDEIPERADAEGTIAMLEGELRDANRAIKELKDALKNAIADQGSNGYGNHSTSNHPIDSSRGTSSLNGTAGNESTPLFFAMEKQAELDTARDEINRLANLLGDAESSKMEAYEAMDEMRRRMEEAEARLHRQEKFEGTVKPPTSSASDNTTTQEDADGNANLEYLKNIMMSYLNAKTIAEKKALVPVIAAVLCLTPEEQAAALKNLDDSGGIEGVGMALFESFGSIRR